MSEQQQNTHNRPARRKFAHLVGNTIVRAWEGNVFSESAEAAFWQTLSLPPLLLGLLGSLGYLQGLFGKHVVEQVRDAALQVAHKVFSQNVVDSVLEPTITGVLSSSHGGIVSFGFLVSLWAGSSAIASFVDAITIAYDQAHVRHDVWQRVFSWLLYLAALLASIVILPLVAIGPDLFPRLFPEDWRGTLAVITEFAYYPVIGIMLILALASLYRLAIPHKLPWHRGLPGATLAMVLFVLSSIGLRIYIRLITNSGYTYGALAAPIAFLLFTFFIGLAIITGAHFNSAVQELWPARTVIRSSRRWTRR
jgi:membrane protein